MAKYCDSSVIYAVDFILCRKGGLIHLEWKQSIPNSYLRQVIEGFPEDLRGYEIVQDYLLQKKRIPGFGHRFYTEVDPRAELILEMLQKNDLGKDYVTAARHLTEELKQQTGKILPLNIDGAIAVALCTFNWSPKLGQSVFIIARTPGLCGQYLNVKNRGIIFL